MAESQGQPAARARQPAGQRASSQKTRKPYEKQNSIFKPEVLLQKVLLRAYVFAYVFFWTSYVFAYVFDPQAIYFPAVFHLIYIYIYIVSKNHIA